jgi:two-component system, chemotaxis family, CheB/CheR fusion protein
LTADPPPDADFEALLDYLRDSRGADFTGYKRPSLTRLVNRRMRTAGVDGYAAYLDLLQVEAGELTALLDVLLINVTSAFRDPAAWQALRERHLPEALAALEPDEPVRVWSAACATGQEAYSLAILLHELLGQEEYLRRVKVYATDVDEGALAVARTGRYAAKDLAGLSPEHRATYFETEGEVLRFRSDLRPSLIFGRHDLLQDAPISRVLLLACRNVLMYLTPETQARVLERFAFALHPSGLLLLGKAEMLLTQSHLFAPVNLSQRIFATRRTTSRQRLTALAVGGQVGVDSRRATELAFVASPAAQIVLDDDGVVAVLNERAQRDLGLSPRDIGRRFAELELSRRPLELRGAVAGVQASSDPVELAAVEASSPSAMMSSGPRWWDVRIAPLHDDGCVLGVHLVFEDVTERHALRLRLQELDRELGSAYEELQSSNEELETTNEELQSAVEELETTNEELQSTNEELETMNEELQSTNEELQTLNDELRERTLEVDQVNGFLQGILGGLDLAVVVVDGDYRVQLWNGGAERITGLRGFEAQGQRLTELPLGLPDTSLRAGLADAVVRGVTPAPVLDEVTDRFGAARRRCLTLTPLRRGGSDEVHGAVLTLTDDQA